MDVSTHTGAGCPPAICAPFVSIDHTAVAWEAGITVGGLLLSVAVLVCLFRVLKRAAVPAAHGRERVAP